MNTTPSVRAVQSHVPHPYFYIITRARGGNRTIDHDSATNYIICNTLADAQDRCRELPTTEGGYAIHSCEVDIDNVHLRLLSVVTEG